MPAEPTFYILILVIASLTLILIALGFMCMSLFYAYKKLRDELIRREHHEAESFKKVIAEAQAQAFKILTDAQRSAQETISKGQLISGDINKNIMVKFDEAFKEQQKTYIDKISEIQKQSLAKVETLPSQVLEEVNNQLKGVLEVFQAQIGEVTKQVSEKLSEPYKQIEAQAEEYKQKRLQDFENSLFDLLTQVSKEVLRKELNLEEHEKMVLKALDKAKRGKLI